MAEYRIVAERGELGAGPPLTPPPPPPSPFPQPCPLPVPALARVKPQGFGDTYRHC